MSYYKQINGARYDRALLDLADQLQSGPRDGRISKADGEQLANARYDGDQSTAVESRTARKIRREANFTPAGRDAFEHTSRSRAQQIRRANEAKLGRATKAE